jgi:hypothetical protein
MWVQAAVAVAVAVVLVLVSVVVAVVVGVMGAVVGVVGEEDDDDEVLAVIVVVVIAVVEVVVVIVCGATTVAVVVKCMGSVLMERVGGYQTRSQQKHKAMQKATEFHNPPARTPTGMPNNPTANPPIRATRALPTGV